MKGCTPLCVYLGDGHVHHAHLEKCVRLVLAARLLTLRKVRLQISDMDWRLSIRRIGGWIYRIGRDSFKLLEGNGAGTGKIHLHELRQTWYPSGSLILLMNEEFSLSGKRLILPLFFFLWCFIFFSHFRCTFV